MTKRLNARIRLGRRLMACMLIGVLSSGCVSAQVSEFSAVDVCTACLSVRRPSGTCEFRGDIDTLAVLSAHETLLTTPQYDVVLSQCQHAHAWCRIHAVGDGTGDRWSARRRPPLAGALLRMLTDSATLERASQLVESGELDPMEVEIAIHVAPRSSCEEDAVTLSAREALSRVMHALQSPQ